jgi:hypothetical protein
MNLISLQHVLGRHRPANTFISLRCRPCRGLANRFCSHNPSNIMAHALYSTCTSCQVEWIVCLCCNVLVSARAKKSHFDAVSGCRKASTTTSHAMMEDSEQTMVGTDDNARTPSDGTFNLDHESTERTEEDWRTNAWLGNPGGIGKFLAKRGIAY